MATFITSKPVGQTIRIRINTSTGYWKYNHDGTDSNIFISGNDQNITVQNANGEFTIISCDITGNPSGDITSMILGSFSVAQDNRITSFDGTGLTGLTNLSLPYNQITSLDNFIFPSSLTTLNLSFNQLTSFNGTGLTSLTFLNLDGNQLTSFDGTGLSGLTTLYLSNNQLTSVNVSGLSSLTQLNLFNNQLTSIDVSPLTNLTNLFVNNNLLDSADNNLILSQLVANGKNNGYASTSGGRTSAGTNDFMTLQSRNWFLQGFNDNTTTTTTTAAPTTTTTTTSAPTTTTTTTSAPTTTTTTAAPTTTTTTTAAPPPTQPVTFVTSKPVGQKINPSVFTGTGYWRVYHNNSYSAIYSNGSAPFGISVENPNGEFTVIACDISGNPGGIINELNLSDGQLTTFNGTGLSSLTSLNLYNNQLTSFNGTGLSSLTLLNLSYNQLTSFNGTGLSSLTDLYLGNNQLTTFNGTGLSSLTYLNLNYNQLTSFNGTGLSSLTYLNLNYNQLTSFNGTGLSSLTDLYLGNNQLTTFNGTGLSSLTDLYLGNNQLTSFNGTGLSGLTDLYLGNNQLTSFDATGLSSLTTLYLNNNQLTSFNSTGLESLGYLDLVNNQLTASTNDSILSQLAAYSIDNGFFATVGGRTSAGTADYNTLIGRGWILYGLELITAPTWYRFKALGTQWTDIVSGSPNNIIQQVNSSGRTTYTSDGYSYFDFLTDDVVSTITFGDGNDNTIEATQVQVTLQEFSSSGSFTAGIGFGGAAIGYANSAIGSWGTLNSGEYPPAIPSRYEGNIPAGSIIFSDILQPVTPEDLMLITAPILLQLSINNNPIDLTGMIGSDNGTVFDKPPRTKFGFIDGETYTFSLTWGELVEVTPPVSSGKLRIKGINQI